MGVGEGDQSVVLLKSLELLTMTCFSLFGYFPSILLLGKYIVISGCNNIEKVNIVHLHAANNNKKLQHLQNYQQNYN